MPPSASVRLLGPSDASVLDAIAPDVFDRPIDPRWAAEFFATFKLPSAPAGLASGG